MLREKEKSTIKEYMTITRNYIDQLPFELQLRVAMHVTNGRETNIALNYALAYPTQRAAISAALSHTLHLSTNDPFTLSNRLAWLLAPHVRRLYVGSSPLSRGTGAACSMLDMDELTEVWMEDEREVFEMLRRRRGKVHKVGVVLKGRMAIEEVVEMLRGMRIVRLTLACCGALRVVPNVRGECLMEDEVVFGLGGLGMGFEKLEGLFIECGRRSWYEANVEGCVHECWRVGRWVRGLREVTVSRVDEEAALGLRGMGRVRAEGREAVRVALGLGEKVIALATADYLGKDMVERVGERCGELEWVACGVTEDADVGFLRWRGSELIGICITWGWTRNGASQYARVGTGVLKRLGQMRQLKEVRLRRVRMGRAELGELLKELGGKLQVLEVSVMGQEEEGLQRINTVLRMLCRWNANVRQLCVFEWEREMRGAEMMMERRTVVDVLASVRALQKNAPLFDATSLRTKLLGLVSLV